MLHSVAIASSLVCLGLVCAIYYCNIYSRPGGWLRSETVAMILLALLTGLFPLALVAPLIGLWGALTAGVSMTALLAAGTDLASLAVVIVTIAVFRSLVKATHRNIGESASVTPFTPRPVGPGVTPRQMKKAA
ncbi:hypothetical protein [Jannaschia formosa]|uniref:hypothetical protein n=1 Tax=Jannaschia formosa TaxID=2259592 RepID=UPI000E1BCA1B|nr:hypothetical protein [Jannaschia formosa]TFL16012.1 hypothetical protein DR046_22225 [Jannaschia formosa]